MLFVIKFNNLLHGLFFYKIKVILVEDETNQREDTNFKKSISYDHQTFSKYVFKNVLVVSCFIMIDSFIRENSAYFILQVSFLTKQLQMFSIQNKFSKTGRN